MSRGSLAAGPLAFGTQTFEPRQCGDCRCYTRSVSDEVLRKRILATFDMFEAGVDLMRQRLKRQYPAETAQQIEVRLAAWLHERPGAEHGDAVGRVGTWPRRPPP